MTLYEKNLKVLENKGIDLNNTPLDKESYKIEKNKEGEYIFRIKKDNKWIYIGRKYNPKEDINDFLEQFKGYDAEANFIIIGFAMGYHIKKLLELGYKNKILIIEPDKKILRYYAEYIDAEEILLKDNVELIVYENENKLESDINNSIGNVINIIKVVKYANYENIYSELVINILKSLKNKYIGLHIFNNTVKKYTYMFQISIWENIKYIIKSHLVNELRDLFKDKTAVVVSAGPSLSKNIHFLKEYQEKVVIICGSRSLKPLLERNIKPHLVCVVDAADMTYEVAKDSIPKDSWFLFANQANHNLVSKVKNRIFCANSEVDVVKEILQKSYDMLPIGGSVAHLCASLAIYTGCQNVLFIGQDFAYTDNKIHDDTAFDKVKENNNLGNNKGTLVEVKGNYKEKVITSYTMSSMIVWLEKFICANSNFNYINCTEGGAFIKGTKVQEFDDTLKNLNLEKIYPLKIINSRFNNMKLNYGNNNVIIKNLEKYKSKLFKTKSLSIKGKKKSEEMLDYYKGKLVVDIEAIFKELDDIDAFMQDIQLKDIINLSMKNIYDIMVLDEYRIKNLEDEISKSQKIAKKCIRMYEAIESSIDDILPLIDKCINDIKNEKIMEGN